MEIAILSAQPTSNSAPPVLLTDTELLRLATEAAEVGLWDLDLLTDTLFWPARVKAMFGISPDVPVSMADFDNGLHPDDRAATTAAFAAALDPLQRSGYNVEYRTVGKEDGLIRWIAAKGRAQFDDSGRCVRVLGTVIDITGRKEIETSLKESEAQLRIAMETLREADRQKNVFLATLGHELRNPLGTLRNALTLMERGESNAAINARARHIIGRQVEQLVRLTEDLLDVNRIGLGKIHLEYEVVALASVLEQAVEACMPSIELASQQLTCVIPDAPVRVHGDFARLVQVFSNLMGNASKYTPEGGSIQVVVRWEGPSVITSVKDSGMGLAGDQLTSVFELFTQIENSTVRSKTGLGIGLALAKQLVELYGGEIEARSEGLEKGSEFVVTLPAHFEAI